MELVHFEVTLTGGCVGRRHLNIIYDEFDYLVATGGRLYTDDITVAEDQIIKASIENRKRIAAYRNATQHIVISKKDKKEDKKVDRTRDE